MTPPFKSLPFIPHPWFRGGHAQTLAGAYLWRRVPHCAEPYVIDLPDGDQLVAHDDVPDVWQPGDRVVLLLHGLAGCHESGYMLRIAHKLAAKGYRVTRLDQRGCGAGTQLARQTFHAGRSEDVRCVIEFIRQKCPSSPVTVVGFSLGAAILLKLLVETSSETIGGLDSAIAVAPPIDLLECSRNIGRGLNKIYDQAFVRSLMRYVRQRKKGDPVYERAQRVGRPRSLYEFDALLTAPLGGFTDVQHYYSSCSTAGRLSQIQIPTRLLTAADDPLVPVQTFHQVDYPETLELLVTPSGGHLGFVGSRQTDADWHWMDWRIVDWIDQFDHR